MALVPFSYANPFTDQLQLKERLFTIDGRHLKIRQAWKGDGKGGTDIGFGASVYPAAYVLAEFLERHPYLVRAKRVIELGTGTGFLGIAAAVLGAAEVCLTDGDEESLKLTKRNVEDNLSLVNRQSPGGSNGHPAGLALTSGRVVESGIAANTNSSSCSSNADNRRSFDNDGISSSDPGTNLGRDSVEARASGSDKTTGAGKDPSITEAAGLGGAEGDRAPRTETGELDTGAASEHVVGSEKSHGSEFGGGDSGVSHAEDNRDQPPPGVYVRKLRWGCTGDIEACRGGSGPWDVVLGSDIAALPYASAYGDLLRTIVSLVKSESPAVPPAGTRGRLSLPWREGEVGAFDPEADGGCVSGRSPSLSGPSVTSDQECRAEGTGRRVLVLLAHKRRHVSEESFFDKLKGALGPGSCRELAEDEVHVDFRGTGIRLHMFEVGV